MPFQRRKTTYRRRPVTRRKRATSRKVRPRYRKSTTRRMRKPRLTVQRIKSFVPDILLTKLKGVTTIRNYRMMDLDQAITTSNMGPGSNNNDTITSEAIQICLNSRPNGGRAIFPGPSAFTSYSTSAAPIYADPYPTEFMVNQYAAYRPYGCKVKIRIVPSDNPLSVGGGSPTGPVAPGPQMGEAAPYVASFLPYQQRDGGRGGFWDGANTPVALSPDDIQQTKYGVRKICQGSGGKSSITFTQYFDLAKVWGQTKTQWLTSEQTRVLVTEANDINAQNPHWETWLMVAIGELCTTANQYRYCNVFIETTQYGRWEGPKVNTR